MGEKELERGRMRDSVDNCFKGLPVKAEEMVAMGNREDVRKELLSRLERS